MTTIDTPTGRYLTASAVRQVDGYADVTPALLGAWHRAGRLPRTTAGDLAAALGRPAPTDPDRLVQYPGPSGPEYVYRWPDVVRAETASRQQRRRRGGRPRRAPDDTPTIRAA